MTTTPTMFDGLLDDDVPTALTTREQVDAELDPDTDHPAPVASADPGDGDLASGHGSRQEAPASPVDPNATEKLVIVEGQTFIVDAMIDNETIREHLIRQGFANLAGAEIRTGTRQHHGQTLPTIDFIKRAGTKG